MVVERRIVVRRGGGVSWGVVLNYSPLADELGKVVVTVLHTFIMPATGG